jgi:mannose-6-phosphate isomerase-like protein (cupin superfamily)
MRVGEEELELRAGSLVKFPHAVPHDVRNPGPARCVIMFIKVNPKVLPRSDARPAAEAARG